MLSTLDRIAWTIAAAGAVVSGLAFLVGAFLGTGAAVGIGALAGASVAVVDWVAVRWLVRLAFSKRARSKVAVGVFMSLKMAMLVAVSYAVLEFLGVNVLGFTLGFSSLVLGIVLGAREVVEPNDDAVLPEGAAIPAEDI